VIKSGTNLKTTGSSLGLMNASYLDFHKLKEN